MSGGALEFRPTVTAARLFAKDKYLEPMFGDVGQARTKAAMLVLMIDTTSSRTCTKPIVGSSTSTYSFSFIKSIPYSLTIYLIESNELFVNILFSKNSHSSSSFFPVSS